eukprot:m.182271 g.182271  ORF g.182271 m.182271 type:complete len:509 (-) comp15490_c0_seq1:230-1756(-)
MNNFGSAADAQRAINLVVMARSCPDAAVAARCISQDILDMTAPWTSLYIRDAIPMIRALLQMLQEEKQLQFLDEYTFLLTGLRQKLETTNSTETKRMANLLILEQTPGLLRVFRRGYAEAPQGYTAPELVSMWSSIINLEGVTLCAPYMDGIEEALMDCMKSPTVGSIVAILLISNIHGDRPSTIEAVLPFFPKVECAFDAAFTGQDFAERKWGPGPVTKCLSKLCGHAKIAARFADVENNDLLQKIEKIIRFGKRDWPVPGFDDSYYMNAKGSACIVISKIAARYDVTRLCPTVQSEIESLVSDPALPPHVHQAANAALLQLERHRRSGMPLDHGPSLDAILSIDRCDAGKVAVVMATGADDLAAGVTHTLTGHGYVVHRVGAMDTADMVHIEASEAVVFCSATKSRVEEPLVVLARYMLALRRPCVHVVASSRTLDDWLGAMIDRSRSPLPGPGITQCNWSKRNASHELITLLTSREVVPPSQADERSGTTTTTTTTTMDNSPAPS